ncbi:MAG: hypothetical protein RL088_78 [Verrucomicrobiota bacterium]
MPSHFGFTNPDFIDDHMHQFAPNGSFDNILWTITLTERGVDMVVHPSDSLNLLGDTVRNFYPEFPLHAQHEFNGIEAHLS